MIFIVLVAALQLVAANPPPVSVAHCKKTFAAGSESQFIGRATWQDEAQNTIVASTEDRTVGRSVLTCTVKLPAKTSAAVLDFGGARIAYDGKDAAGGLEITASATDSHCTISGLRIARENWMELGPALYALQFTRPIDRVTLVFTLLDSSPAGGLRADINPVVIRAGRPGETVLPCPPH